MFEQESVNEALCVSQPLIISVRENSRTHIHTQKKQIMQDSLIPSEQTEIHGSDATNSSKNLVDSYSLLIVPHAEWFGGNF